jgi:hypothetical protein
LRAFASRFRCAAGMPADLGFGKRRKKEDMRTIAHKSVELGELVAAAFDTAAELRTEPRELSRLAASVVMSILRRKGTKSGSRFRPRAPKFRQEVST